MSDLIQSVTDGVIQQTKNAAKDKPAGNALGKDAFLQLLVTQMKYQDPLNPNTDTEFIAQLATFSQLEQMQNLSSLTTNSQAFSLVGKQVIVKAVSHTGNTTYVSGRVDFVNMAAGKAQLSINGTLYGIDQLDSVIDDIYIIEKGLPKVKNKLDAEYDAANPADISFDVSFGEGDTVADNVAVLVNGVVLNAAHIKLSGGKVTIDKAALADYPIGNYKVTVVFNDPFYTTIKDMINIRVKNTNPTPTNPQESGQEPEDI